MNFFYTCNKFRDHPRVCGEQWKLPCKALEYPGSPPRVRGTVVKGLVKCLSVRITPACAGNSIRRGFAGKSGRDHPRVCGEQIMTDRKAIRRLGSPPRVRGTAMPRDGMDALVGITPACAGNRVKKRPECQAWKDHPRVCGEQGLTCIHLLM